MRLLRKRECMEYGFEIKGEYKNTLDIDGFSQMLKDPSYSYKFYWLEALVSLITENKLETTFDEVIDEMISNAWYTVIEFHIHLTYLTMGEARDGIEKAVRTLKECSDLASNASKVEIKNEIKKHNKELKTIKNTLTRNVPFRALAGFFGNQGGIECDWNSLSRLVDYIERVNNTKVQLPYTMGTSGGLDREIHISETWASMIKDNAVSILGWIQYEKVRWLQNCNPEVPGLVYKLAPLDDKIRKLNNVHKIWDAIMEYHPIRDVFTDDQIAVNDYDVDHFVPWSFVMNDELWNLMPMDSSLNSSKSNKLPQWEPFFKKFADNQFIMYQEVHDKDKIHALYEKCIRDNLHSIWAAEELYRPGNNKELFYSILEKNMRPVYDSARRQGYEMWMM